VAEHALLDPVVGAQDLRTGPGTTIRLYARDRQIRARQDDAARRSVDPRRPAPPVRTDVNGCGSRPARSDPQRSFPRAPTPEEEAIARREPERSCTSQRPPRTPARGSPSGIVPENRVDVVSPRSLAAEARPRRVRHARKQAFGGSAVQAAIAEPHELIIRRIAAYRKCRTGEEERH
jgi:hypothetical protein